MCFCYLDIGNAYLNANFAENIYTVGGREFGPKLQGKGLIVSNTLCGLKLPGAAWRQHLSSSMKGRELKSSRSDTDLYLCTACKPDGEQYHEYLLVNVDDIICISHATAPIMKEFEKVYHLKNGNLEMIAAKVDNHNTSIC